MKREIRNAISKAIKESNLNGYTWKIIENGLKWSYCDIEFHFDEKPQDDFLIVKNDRSGVNAAIWYGEDKYADCKTLTEAYYLATKAIIRTANNVF